VVAGAMDESLGVGSGEEGTKWQNKQKHHRAALTSSPHLYVVSLTNNPSRQS